MRWWNQDSFTPEVAAFPRVTHVVCSQDCCSGVSCFQLCVFTVWAPFCVSKFCAGFWKVWCYFDKIPKFLSFAHGFVSVSDVSLRLHCERVCAILSSCSLLGRNSPLRSWKTRRGNNGIASQSVCAVVSVLCCGRCFRFSRCPAECDSPGILLQQRSQSQRAAENVVRFGAPNAPKERATTLSGSVKAEGPRASACSSTTIAYRNAKVRMCCCWFVWMS